MTAADEVALDAPSVQAQAGDSPVTDAQPRCMVCKHDVAAHDPIGLRFCSATQSQALSRGCICR